MIKQAKNKLIIIRTFQILLIITGSLVQYFSTKKMGVQRTITYYNYYWQERYHLKEIIFILAILLLIYTIYRWFKYKKINIISLFCPILTLLLVFANSGEFKLTKYALSIILVLVNILELIKTGENYEKN